MLRYEGHFGAFVFLRVLEGHKLVDLGPKSGRKSGVLNLLMTEFERPGLNWHIKGMLVECNIIVHVTTAHRFAVVSKLNGCQVPTLEISDATTIKAGQLLNAPCASCCSRLIVIKIPADCLLCIARWRSEGWVGQFQPVRSSTFPASSPQRLTQIGSNLVYTLLLRSCLLCSTDSL